MQAKENKETKREDEKIVDNVQSKPDLYSRLVTFAPFVAGDISPLVPIQDIPWIDDSLVKHGLVFYSTHLTQSVFASILFFLLGLPVKPITGVILKGQMGDPAVYFSRFLSTIQLITECFLFYLDPEKVNKTYAYIQKRHNLARKRYARPSTKPIQPRDDNLFVEDWKKEVSHAVSADLEHIDTSSAPKELLSWKSPLAVSQYEMAIIQFTYIWMFWGFPRLFGIKNREKELKGVIHLWAIQGRMIGIEDEYNICLKPDPKLYDLLTRNFLIESLKNMDETVITVQHTLIEAMRVRIPFMTYKAMLYIGLEEIQGRQGENLWKIMNFWDKASFRFLQGWMWLARQSFVVRIILDIPTGIWLMFNFRRDIIPTIRRYLLLLRTFAVKKVTLVLKMSLRNIQSAEIIRK